MDIAATQEFSSAGPAKGAPDRVHLIATFWQNQKKSGRSILSFAIRHPASACRVALATWRLPVLEAVMTDGPGGKAIRNELQKHRAFLKSATLGRTGVCLLNIPADPQAYSAGSSKQTLRRKVRAAQKSGVTCRSIDTIAERQALLKRIHEVLPTKSSYAYTNDNSSLIDHPVWTAAFGPGGEPLVIAVTPYDGKWALLRFFNSLGETTLHSDARYLLTQTLVERLSSIGVRHLFDGVGPHKLSAGLWQFQRMIGFELSRVRATSRGAKDRGAPAAHPVRQAVKTARI